MWAPKWLKKVIDRGVDTSMTPNYLKVKREAERKRLSYMKAKAEERRVKVEALLLEVKAFRDIGRKFKYLGLEMIVLGHRIQTPFVGDRTMSWPGIKAQYVNSEGNIIDKDFTAEQLPVLRAENSY